MLFFFQVDVTNRTREVDLSNYVNNGEWELLSIRIVRNVVFYACCLEPFPDVTFYIQIRRRTLYYMYNVIFPCIMMSALTLLVFCLPPDSGEKIALGKMSHCIYSGGSSEGSRKPPHPHTPAFEYPMKMKYLANYFIFMEYLRIVEGRCFFL